MTNKIKKYEKMIRGNPVDDKDTNIKETLNVMRLNELEYLKHRIIVNSLRHIQDTMLKEKCTRITTHYRLFKNDESLYTIAELTDAEKEKFENCIGECIQKESAGIIADKNCVPEHLLKLIEIRTELPSILKNKLNTLLSLLNTFADNRNDIYHSIFKLQDSRLVNIEKMKQLVERTNVVNHSSNKLLSNIISMFPKSENSYESLEAQYNARKKEYAENLEKFENLKRLQDKYNQVDGPQYKALVKRFIQTQEIIKIKTEMFNSY